MLLDLQAYTLAVNALEASVLENISASFAEASTDVEAAERAFRLSRDRLRHHIAVHSCD